METASHMSIGLGKKTRRAYGFDEIALVPTGNTLDLELCDTSWQLGNFSFDVPIIASAMDGVVSPKNASAAIIINKYDQVLLQLRDDREGIFFPNHWGFFGGGCEDGEDFSESLIRELEEELTF